MNEHPDAFREANAQVDELLRGRPFSKLDVQLWGEPPFYASAWIGETVYTGRGESPAAALRSLAAILRRLPPPSSDISER